MQRKRAHREELKALRDPRKQHKQLPPDLLIYHADWEGKLTGPIKAEFLNFSIDRGYRYVRIKDVDHLKSREGDVSESGIVKVARTAKRKKSLYYFNQYVIFEDEQ